MKSVDWEKEFYEKFVNHGEFVYNKGGHPATTGEIWSFIRTLLSTQRKEILEMIGEDQHIFASEYPEDQNNKKSKNELRAELRNKLKVEIIEK